MTPKCDGQYPRHHRPIFMQNRGFDRLNGQRFIRFICPKCHFIKLRYARRPLPRRRPPSEIHPGAFLLGDFIAKLFHGGR